MNLRRGLAAYLVVASVAAAAMPTCVRADAAAADAEWRAERLASLTSETGWLTLVGLYWLRDGANTIGRARRNTISLDYPQLGPHAGTFTLAGSSLRFDAARGSCFRVGGAPASAEVKPDSAGEPTLLTCGSLQLFVIERGGKFGVRIRDTASRARREFRGVDYYPFDPGWIADARFEAYEPHHRVPIVNVLGMDIDMESPGAIIFARDGQEWRLDTLLEAPDADTLFVMFADSTSGKETYGAGRFLSIPLPAAGRVAVDFNRSYSPPCAFTPFATCPLPPPQNRLALRVSAGELRYVAPGRQLD